MYSGSLEPISDQFPVFLLGKEDEESHSKTYSIKSRSFSTPRTRTGTNGQRLSIVILVGRYILGSLAILRGLHKRNII